jgi:alpha-2-macroglobulin
VLNSFVKAGVAEAPIRQLVRGLMTAREGGRWGNTQENAYAMEALVNYYRRYEPETPNFRAVAKLGEHEVASGEFRQRSTEATTKQIPLNQVPAQSAAPAPLTFTRDGTGTLFYTARLRYAIDQAFTQGMDSGFQAERTYRPYRESGPDLAPAAAYQAGDLVRCRPGSRQSNRGSTRPPTRWPPASSRKDAVRQGWNGRGG